MVVRTPWNNFPPVTVHTDGATLKSHPAYSAAKNGDGKAASYVVQQIYTPGKIAARPDYIVPVQQLDQGRHWNALPLEFARVAARDLGAQVLPLVVQDNILPHNETDANRRIASQPSFTGKVPKGSYVIVDDAVTLGSTLANLRGYIEHRGGSVLQASTLTAGVFSTRIAPEPGLVSSIKRRFPNELTVFPETLGFSVDCLTNREGHYVYGLRNLEALRTSIAPQINFIRPSL